MGVALQGLQAGLLNQSSAQVIDGSLNIESSKSQYLSRLPGSSGGNRKTWTWSCWVKKTQDEGLTDAGVLFEARIDSPSADADIFGIRWLTDGKIGVYDTGNFYISGTREFRDTSAWYHLVLSVDTTQASNNLSLYVNNDLYLQGSYAQNTDTRVNDTCTHRIGARTTLGSQDAHFLSSQLTQTYFIDGHALGPEYFGYTDPLTNTWRPKKRAAFPKRTFTNPKWYSSATLYTSVADVVASATDRGNGGVTVTDEYCYLVFNDGGYANSGGGTNSPDYPVWTDAASFDDGSGGTISRLFYYDTSEGDNWKNAGSLNSTAGEWNQWRYSNGTSFDSYRIGKDYAIDNGNMLVFCANATIDNPTNAGKLSSATLPTFDTKSFNFQNSVIDTWYMGGNSFYLPFDGNSPINQDKSGNGNDWTPVNFGGFNSIDKATGAQPILSTVSGGKVATVGVRTDAYASNLVLALPLVGIATDVSNRINSGSTKKVVTVSGDPASNTAQSNFYGASFYFDGSASSDYVSVADNTEVDVGNGDFTIECWTYVSGYPNNNPGLLSKRGANGAAHWQLVLNRNGLIQFGDQATWSNDFGTSSGTTGDTIFKDNWHHIAITRTSGSVQAWYDGRKYGTAITNTTDFDTSANFSVGVGKEDTYDPFQGYVNDVRVYKGVAKYTDSFIPASTNPNILPETPSGVSGGSKLTKITDGSVRFDGAGDFLVAGDGVSSDLAPGTGNFTLEFFLYADTVVTSDPGIISWSTTPAGQTSYVGAGFIAYNDSLQQLDIQLGTSGSSAAIDSGAGSVPQYKWNHIAIVRDTGNEFRVYVDGVLTRTDTSTLAGTDITAKYMIIGKYYNNDNYVLNGNISNLRFIKGTALYTSNFTPPTAPLTDITNTKLLCCQSNTTGGVAAVSPNITGSINTGTVWSDLVKGTLDTQYGNVNRAFPFNGASKSSISSSDGIRPPSGSLLTMDFGTQFNSATKLKIYAQTSLDGSTYAGTNENLEINGTALTAGEWAANGGGGAGSTDPATFTLSSGLQTLAWGYDYGSTSSGYVYLAGIEVDDVLLVNPITPMGFGNAVSNVLYGDEGSGATNFNPFSTNINTVRGQETGYATLNPLDSNYGSNLKDGNLRAVGSSSWSAGHGRGTIPITSGKWFWEGTSAASGNTAQFGFANSSASLTESYGSAPANSWTMVFGNGTEIITPAANGSGYFGGSAISAGDVIGVALDMDNGTWQFFKNGVGGDVKTLVDTDSGSTASITELYPWVGVYAATIDVNFGQKPFKFPPPEGYQSLNYANLTRPEFVRPDSVVGVTTYAGDGTSVHPHDLNPSLNFSPDFIWIKGYTDPDKHGLYDTVRGATKRLQTGSQGTNGQDTQNGVMEFLPNGFRIGDYAETNGVDRGYVAWCWKAGGNKGTFNKDDVGYASAAAAGLDGGSTNPTAASVNTKSKFGIYTFDGDSANRTLSHGLGQQPDFMIVKKKSASGNSWVVWHKSIDNTKYLILNGVNNEDTDATLFNSHGSDSSTLWTLGSNTSINETGQSSVAYLWCDVPGLQKFGKYTGNASGNPFIELGFRPALLWIKNTSTSSTDWILINSERQPINSGTMKKLYANTDSSESNTGIDVQNNLDLLSNGFKLRDSNNRVNATGDVYIYAAWAEAPMNNLFGGQSNAR